MTLTYDFTLGSRYSCIMQHWALRARTGPSPPPVEGRMIGAPPTPPSEEHVTAMLNPHCHDSWPSIPKLNQVSLAHLFKN